MIQRSQMIQLVLVLFVCVCVHVARAQISLDSNQQTVAGFSNGRLIFCLSKNSWYENEALWLLEADEEICCSTCEVCGAPRGCKGPSMLPFLLHLLSLSFVMRMWICSWVCMWACLLRDCWGLNESRLWLLQRWKDRPLKKKRPSVPMNNLHLLLVFSFWTLRCWESFGETLKTMWQSHAQSSNSSQLPPHQASSNICEAQAFLCSCWWR